MNGGDHSNSTVIVTYKQLFDALFNIHHGVEHLFCDPLALHQETKRLFGCSVTYFACHMFLMECPHCLTESNCPGVRAGGNPIVEMKPMRRIQLDCIDYQTEHRHLMTRLALLDPEDPERQAWDFDEASYQEFLKSHDKGEKDTNGYSIVPRYIVTIGDHFSKLRRYFPVHSKRPAVIARCLSDWVSMYGPFDVLHADNGTDVMNVAGFDPNLYSRETTNDDKYKQYRISFTDLQKKSIIDHVRWMIPGILCVHGLPYHSESQGFIENCNKFARKYLRKYMQDFGILYWWTGMANLNYRALTASNRATGMSPYEVMWGVKPQEIGGLAYLQMTHPLVKSFWCESLIVNYLMRGGSPGLLEAMYEQRPGCDPLNIFHPDLTTRFNMNLNISCEKSLVPLQVAGCAGVELGQQYIGRLEMVKTAPVRHLYHLLSTLRPYFSTLRPYFRPYDHTFLPCDHAFRPYDHTFRPYDHTFRPYSYP